MFYEIFSYSNYQSLIGFINIIRNDCVDYFVPIVLKPLSAECHVVMDQSSDIVLDTPKVHVVQYRLISFFNVITVAKKKKTDKLKKKTGVKKGYHSTIIYSWHCLYIVGHWIKLDILFEPDGKKKASVSGKSSFEETFPVTISILLCD